MENSKILRVCCGLCYVLAALVLLVLDCSSPNLVTANTTFTNPKASTSNQFVFTNGIVDTVNNRFYSDEDGTARPDRLKVLDLNSGQLIKEILYPTPLNFPLVWGTFTVNPVAKRLYISTIFSDRYSPQNTNGLENALYVYNLDTFSLINSTSFPPINYTNSLFNRLFNRNIMVNTGANLIYFYERGDPESNKIQVADGDSLDIIATIQPPVGSNLKYSLPDVNPTTKRLYLIVTPASGDNFIRVLDASSYAIITDISISGGVLGLDISPTANKLFVVNTTGDFITIDGSTNSIISSVPKGNQSIAGSTNIYIGAENSFSGEPVNSSNSIVNVRRVLYNSSSATLPGKIFASASPTQTAQVGTTFVKPLETRAVNVQGLPLSNFPVTFTAPTSGASATFPAGATVTTDVLGRARLTVGANTTPGTYNLTANFTSSVSNPATFILTNVTTPLGTFSLLPVTVRLATTLDNSRPLLTAISPLPNPKDASSTLIQAAGVSGIPPDATGIVGTLTNVGCTGGGNFRFWAGEAVPATANNLNVPGANFNLNLTTSFAAPLDSQGRVYLGLASGTNITCGYAVDVTGYYVQPTTSASNLSLLPATVRLATTLDNSRPLLTATNLTPNPSDSSTVLIQAVGTGGIPAGATGIIGTLTNIGCTGGGNFRFWTGTSVPASANNLNVPGANATLNLTASFVAPLDSQGRVYLGFGSGGNVSCGYAVDVSGYISPAGTGGNTALLAATVRLTTSLNAVNQPLTASGATPSIGDKSSLLIGALKLDTLPANASGLIGTLTNVGCSAGGNLRFWSGASVPTNATNLNVPGSNPKLNLTASFITAVDSAGKLYLGFGSNPSATCGFAVDVASYIVK